MKNKNFMVQEEILAQKNFGKQENENRHFLFAAWQDASDVPPEPMLQFQFFTLYINLLG